MKRKKNGVLFKDEGLYTVDFQCPSGIRVDMISKTESESETPAFTLLWVGGW